MSMNGTDLSQEELRSLRDFVEAETRYLYGVDDLPEEIGRVRRRVQRGQRPANLGESAIRKWLKERA